MRPCRAKQNHATKSTNLSALQCNLLGAERTFPELAMAAVRCTLSKGMTAYEEASTTTATVHREDTCASFRSAATYIHTYMRIPCRSEDPARFCRFSATMTRITNYFRIKLAVWRCACPDCAFFRHPGVTISRKHSSSLCHDAVMARSSPVPATRHLYCYSYRSSRVRAHARLPKSSSLHFFGLPSYACTLPYPPSKHAYPCNVPIQLSCIRIRHIM
jgi:hypothetical protein